MKTIYIFIFILISFTTVAAQENILVAISSDQKISDDFTDGMEISLNKRGLKYEKSSCNNLSCLKKGVKDKNLNGGIFINVDKKNDTLYKFKVTLFDSYNETEKTELLYFENSFDSYKELSIFGKKVVETLKPGTILANRTKSDLKRLAAKKRKDMKKSERDEKKENKKLKKRVRKLEIDKAWRTHRPYKDGDHYFYPINLSVFYPISFAGKNDTVAFNFSLLYNNVGSIEGADLGIGLSVVNRDVVGFQSNIANYVRGNLKGFQTASAFSYLKGDLIGAQASGIFNYNEGDIKGVQFAGLFNYTKGDIEGVQFAPVNISGDINGGQVGVVNIADDVDGFQIGLVNISKKMRGLPLGLINIADNGGISIVSWGSNFTALNGGIKFRAGNFYSIISVGGLNIQDRTMDSFTFGYHYGFHISFNKFYFETDLGYSQYFEDSFSNKYENDMEERFRSDSYILQSRVTAGVKVFPSLSVFAGVGISHKTSWNEDFDCGETTLHVFTGIELF